MDRAKKIYKTWTRKTMRILGVKPYRARIYALTHISGPVVFQVKFYKDAMPEKVFHKEEDAIEYANKCIAFLGRQQSIEFEP